MGNGDRGRLDHDSGRRERLLGQKLTGGAIIVTERAVSFFRLFSGRLPRLIVAMSALAAVVMVAVFAPAGRLAGRLAGHRRMTAGSAAVVAACSTFTAVIVEHPRDGGSQQVADQHNRGRPAACQTGDGHDSTCATRAHMQYLCNSRMISLVSDGDKP